MTATIPNGRPCERCGGKVVVHAHDQSYSGPIHPPVATLLICPTCDPPCGWCVNWQALREQTQLDAS